MQTASRCWMVMAFSFVAVFLLPACSTGYVHVASWAEHERVWIGYYGDTDMPVDLDDPESRARPVQDAMIDGLAPHVPVAVLVETEPQAEWVREHMRERGHSAPEVTVHVVSPNDMFIRDPGPLMLRDSGTGAVAAADFRYSDYSNVSPEEYTEKALNHESIDRVMAERLELETVDFGVAIEGGAVISNGAGVTMFGRLIERRNPHLTREQIEDAVRLSLGAKTVIWLGEGVGNVPLNLGRIGERQWGYGTGGHTDQYARFVDETTVMLAWVPESERDLSDVHALTAERMAENERILLAARDHRGRSFRVVRVPLPLELPTEPFEMNAQTIEYVWTVEQERTNADYGERPQLGEMHEFVAAGGYLNFVVSNGVVLVPAYAGASGSREQRERDEEVQRIFAEAFPGRVIVPIDPTPLNFRGGGMHCVTLEEPVR